MIHSTLSISQLDLLARAMHPQATRQDQYWLCPWKAMRTPDSWQSLLLTEMVTKHKDVMLCCSSQIGKTEVVSVGAYLCACLGMYVLVVSPSDRQSIRFHSRLLRQHGRLQLRRSLERPNKHVLTLEGGGRVEALPNSPDKIRGIDAVDLLIVDEASRVSDDLFGACTRMLAVSGGKIALLSTPAGRNGFFYREWTSEAPWSRHHVTWKECPRITTEHIEAERARFGDWWVRQEYEGEFLGAQTAVFDRMRFEALVDPSLKGDW